MTRVLVIEDSPTQAQRLAFILEDAGFEVETAPDAEQSFKRLAGALFDLVLSDLYLPGDSGFDICRRMKADPRYRHIPVLVHTSQADPANVLRGLEAGADGFMTKDRDPAEIINRIHRAINRAERPAAADVVQHTRVVFLNQEFDLSAGREQLLDVLVSSFEDVVHLHRRAQENAAALRELNGQLQNANVQLEQRNRQLQQLADELAESVRSERKAHEERKKAESQLVQVEKLSGLGQMVAGIAHEVNNPLAFVSNNIAVLQRDVASLRDLLVLYQESEETLAQHQPVLLDRIRTLAKRIDVPYTLENLEGLVVRSREGLKRIQQIVKDLRDFARLDESDLHQVDVNEGVQSTINLIRSRAQKQRVALEVHLGCLPGVTCYPAKINQVVLNLVANAIDACQPGGKVTVNTVPANNGVEIHVLDTGCGIDPAIRDKIFDPFFTTKPLGQGIGLGLSISYGIVQAHSGTITFTSDVGAGTHFVVHLPRQPPEQTGPSVAPG